MIIRLLIILTINLFIFCTYSEAASQKKIIAAFPTWKPYGYLEHNKPTGFEIEIFSVLMEKMNYQVEFRHLPWKRCLLLAKSGKVDAIISALKVEERQEYLYYPDEHISINTSALFTTKHHPMIQFDGDLSKLTPYTIGVMRGFSYGKEFDNASYLRKNSSTQVGTIVKMLIKNRYQLGIGNIPTVITTAKDLGVLDKIVFLKPYIHSSKLYVGFSKKKQRNKKLHQKFSEHLRLFKKTNHYKSLQKKYGFNGIASITNME